MAKIALSLDISSSNDPKVMRLYDTSFYGDGTEIENYLLEVLAVNKSTWMVFRVSRGFSFVLNSSNLHYLKATDEAHLIDLPDGIYEIKQSIKPNTYTLSHIYHLRIVTLYRRIQSERKKLMDDSCSISRAEYIENRDKLRDIEEYLYGAKWMVEECGDKKRGKEMYDMVSKKLEQYTNECQCQ